MADSPEKVKRDWKEIVSKNDTLQFCPDKFLEETKEWLAKREKLSDEVSRVSKIEMETKMALENLVFKIRGYLEETGHKNAYSSEVGFQGEALKEGIYILSIEDK